MSGEWKEVKIAEKLFTNVKEAALRRATAAIENAFPNEAGGQTRFPGMRDFCTLAGNAPTYLHDWNGDLVAVSNSRVYRIDSDGNTTDVTGVPLSGGKRAIFDKTPNELLMAAGAQILRLGGDLTEVLSDDAPLSTHVQFVDDFVLAIEVGTGVFFHCEAGQYRQWDPIDVFAANGKPDPLNGMIVTPYREIILTGPDSIEQFNRLNSGDTPFYRRWSLGEGIVAPYTLTAFDQGVWAIDKKRSLNRFTGQVSEPRSDDINRTFEGVDDWTDTWAAEMNIVGQKFLLVQFPYATNVYGTKGITVLYDIRQKKWMSLYGWDEHQFVPNRWPGWSYYKMWDRHFVGGNGKVHELVEGIYTNNGVKQRMLGRTAHIDEWGESSVTNVRMRIKRGVGTSNDPDVAPPSISLQCIKDNTKRTRPKAKSLGRPGQTEMTLEFGPMGIANTWQFQWEVFDDCEVELIKLEAQVERVGEG